MQVSVVIPVYKAGKFIESAVKSALEQPGTAEVILVEDGSPDDTLEICRRLEKKYEKVKVFTHPGNINKGAGQSRNLGIEKASYEYIALLDADNLFLPGRFQAERKLFAERPDIDGVYGALGFHYYSEEGRKKYEKLGYGKLTTLSRPVPPEELFWALMAITDVKGQFALDALTFKKSALEKTEPFENLELHDDTAFKIKLAFNCKLVPGVIDRPVGLRGVHDDNQIVNNPPGSKTRVRLYENLYRWAVNKDLSPKHRRVIKNHLRVAEIKSSGKLKAFFLTAASAVSSPMFLRHRVFFIECVKHLLGEKITGKIKKLKNKLK